ncbi:flagellar hook-length control protein FliK [Brevibacillus dissolubilis]|uniref:flagellar hook-length control protein FliK n=1 Tax=Brevibacillus dissolubilis TaxID=1844116 RepID=UPI001116E2C9|nr:flagellar hook-length control protein FliK [Brevibacillus dissolubilis]
MNVSNLMGQVQAQPGLVTTGAGTQATVGQGTPAGLFALTMGNALLTLEAQPELIQELPQGVNPEDIQEMGDLLALLGAMLAGTMQETQVEQVQVQENGKTLSVEEVSQNFVGKLTQLLGSLKQDTPQHAQAAELARAFNELVQNTATDKTEQGVKLVKQATDFLAQFGAVVDEVETTVTKENKIQAPWGAKAFAVVNPQQVQTAAVDSKQDITPVQSMRVNRALSMYQAETLTVKQTLTNQVDLTAQTATGLEGIEGNNQGQANTVTNLSVANQQTNATVQQAAQGYNVRADQFGQEVSDVFVRQMKVNGLSGVTETKLILHPQALGQVHVKITAENGVITAHFVADNASSKDIIDNQLSQLRTALVQQGLTVDKLEVSHQPQNQQQQQPFDMNGQREQTRDQAQQQQNQRQQDETTDNSFDAVMQTTQVTATSRGNIDVTL